MPNSVGFPKGQLAKQLKKVSILGALSQSQLNALAKWAGVVSFEKGETVVKQGDKGDGLFMILEGSAEVRRGSRVLARLDAGQLFGEMSLFDNQPRSADVVAADSAKMAALQKWEFWGYAASEPSVVLRVLEEVSLRFRAANQALAD